MIHNQKNVSAGPPIPAPRVASKMVPKAPKIAPRVALRKLTIRPPVGVQITKPGKLKLDRSQEAYETLPQKCLKVRQLVPTVPSPNIGHLFSDNNHNDQCTRRQSALTYRVNELEDELTSLYDILDGEQSSSSEQSSPEEENPVDIRPMLHTESMLHDPLALENFLKLMSRKEELMKTFTEASTASRLQEWHVNWKQFKIGEANQIGKLQVSDPNFETFNKTKLNQNIFLTKHFENISTAKAVKQELEFVNEEIDEIFQRHLQTEELNEPFLTISFNEFIQQKIMKMNMVNLHQTQEYYRSFTETLFDELMDAESKLTDSIIFIKELYRKCGQNALLTPKFEQDFQRVISTAYNLDNHLAAPDGGWRINIKRDLKDLECTVRDPLIDMTLTEPPAMRNMIYTQRSSTQSTNAEQSSDSSSTEQPQMSIMNSHKEAAQISHVSWKTKTGNRLNTKTKPVCPLTYRLAREKSYLYEMYYSNSSSSASSLSLSNESIVNKK